MKTQKMSVQKIVLKNMVNLLKDDPMIDPDQNEDASEVEMYEMLHLQGMLNQLEKELKTRKGKQSIEVPLDYMKKLEPHYLTSLRVLFECARPWESDGITQSKKQFKKWFNRGYKSMYEDAKGIADLLIDAISMMDEIRVIEYQIKNGLR